MTPDVQLFSLLNSLAGQSPFLDGVIVFFASHLAYILIAIFFLFLLVIEHSNREKIRIFLITLVSAIVARFGITELIRFFYHRPRPFTDLTVNQLLTSNEWSFPSGHSTFFFALSTAVYLHNKKWGIGFFIATILMTVSRVIAGIHYLTDILGGAIIGIAVACAANAIIRRMILSTPDPQSRAIGGTKEVQ